jgi:hypothetical protein
MEFEERFWSKVAWGGDEECWQWLRATNRDGYGQFHVPGHGMGAAHRVAYELEVGEIPKGLTLDHNCENKSCVNPLHLEPVTQAENNRRKMRVPNCRICGTPYRQKKRQRYCPDGKNHP